MPSARLFQLRCPLAGRGRAIAACALLSTAAAASGGGPGGVVHGPPQTPAHPTDHQAPIYCPRTAAEAALAVPGETPEALLAELAELHSTLRLEPALRVAQRLVEIAPDRPAAHYNLACVLAKLHRVEPALDALETAVALGWRRRPQTLLDLDLDAIRHEPRFAAITATMRELEHHERLRPVPLRDDPWDVAARDLAEAAPIVLRRHRVPGVTMALIHDGRLVWTGAAGVTHRLDGGPMIPETPFVGPGPAHLLALAALVREDAAGLIPAAQVVQLARGGDGPHGETRELDPPPSLRLVRGATMPISAAPDAAPVRVSFAHRALVHAVPLAVEISTGTSYAGYCHATLLEPAGAHATGVVPRAERVPGAASGHTAMGTPVGSAAGGDGSVVTTAPDAGRLVAGLLASGEGGRPAIDVLRRIVSADPPCGTDPRPLTLTDRAGDPRVELAGEYLGCGWLIRWHPEHGRGFVVFYNAEGGAPAARRLAQLALGGI